jgi:hypothetical protein
MVQRAPPLRNAFQASDLPDAAAALEGRSKSVMLQHRQHRARRVGKPRKLLWVRRITRLNTL